MRNITRRLGVSVRYLLLGIPLALVGHGAANADVCIRADIGEEMRLPDGSIHDAGILKLCLNRNYSPVSALHTASIGKRSLGFITSRRAVSEGAQDEPFMMFVRATDGALQLYGYALPEGSRMLTYRLQSPPPEAPVRIAARTVALESPAGAE